MFFTDVLCTVAEMRDGPGEDLAHGALFLRPVRQTVRRGWVPRAGRPPVLPGRLLRHVRAQVRRMHAAHNGELRVGPVHAVALHLFRLPSKSRHRYRCVTLLPNVFQRSRPTAVIVLGVVVAVPSTQLSSRTLLYSNSTQGYFIGRPRREEYRSSDTNPAHVTPT